MQLTKMRDAFLRGLLLSLGLEQEFVDPADAQGLREIIKRPVLGPALATTTLLLSANRKTFDIGSAQQIGVNLDLAHEPGFALSQRERRFSAELVNPSHHYG